MRDYLGARNLVAWEDEGYVVGVIGRDGQYLPGKAAKWHAGERLMDWMEEMPQGEEMVVDDEQDPEKKSTSLTAMVRSRNRRGEWKRASFMAARIKSRRTESRGGTSTDATPGNRIGKERRASFMDATRHDLHTSP